MPFALVFSQCLGAPFVTYILLLPSLLFKRFDGKIWAGVLLILSAIVSLIIRDGSYGFVLKAIQYYFGVLVIYFAFHLNKKIVLNQWVFIIFSSLVAIEFIGYKIGYRIFYIEELNLDEVGLTNLLSITGEYYRALGPALNSSVTSVILAIQLFRIKNKKKNYKLVLLYGSTFLMCWSGSGFISLAILIISKYRLKISHVIFISIMTIVSILIINYFNPPKLNSEYLYLVLGMKIKYLEILNNNFIDLIMGMNLDNINQNTIGGDAALVNSIENFGLILIALLSYLLIRITPSKNKVLVLVGLISSIHYGVIFSLTGQVIFGAIMAGSVQFGGEKIPENRS